MLEHVHKRVKHHQAEAGITSISCLPITPFIRREFILYIESPKEPRCLCAGGLLAGCLRAVDLPISFWQEFDQVAHLTVMNVAIDSHAHLSILQVHVK